MRDEYIKRLHGTFNASQEAQRLFERIAETPTAKREGILGDVNRLKRSVGLSYSLMALYRQQVNSGFVLGDPVEMEGRNCKRIPDPDTGITFQMQWNPHRELRRNHALLVERRVISENVDQSKLINKREDGTACYLCKTNIDEQNPGEVLVGIELAGERFYAGANFSYITNNHFTVMNGRHRPQQYRKEIPQILNDFVEKTAGHFRAIFNGRAGASILWHEHIQVTTESFPIEQIRIDDAHIIHESGDTRVSRPDYYIPLWVIEGSDKEGRGHNGQNHRILARAKSNRSHGEYYRREVGRAISKLCNTTGRKQIVGRQCRKEGRLGGIRNRRKRHIVLSD